MWFFIGLLLGASLLSPSPSTGPCALPVSENMDIPWWGVALIGTFAVALAVGVVRGWIDPLGWNAALQAQRAAKDYAEKQWLIARGALTPVHQETHKSSS
jgi:hypothetical protein